MLKENAELESFVLSVIERTKKGQHIEDSAVELKSSLIDPISAARRIAAHANSAFGQTIVWIIGLSEQGEVVGVDNAKIHEWFAKIAKEFDEIAPEIRELVITSESKSLLALQIRTDRAPYVIRNPKYGQAESGPVEREIPMREGTSVRSARRSDLVKMLASDSRAIEFEFLSSSLSLSRTNNQHYSLSLQISVYAYLQFKADSPLTIPFHKIKLKIIGQSSNSRIEDNNGHIFGQIVKDSNISGGNNEIILFGPSKLTFQFNSTLEIPNIQLTNDQQLLVEIGLYIYEKQKTVYIEFSLNKDSIENNVFNANLVAHWSARAIA